jgi:hypothetical protein
MSRASTGFKACILNQYDVKKKLKAGNPWVLYRQLDRSSTG